MDLSFFSRKSPKVLSIFSARIRGFCGVKPGPLGPPVIHLAPHEIKLGFITKNIEFLTEMSKKPYFPFYEDAIYVVKSKVLYIGQFMMDLDKIWYKSRPTQGALTHQISS